MYSSDKPILTSNDDKIGSSSFSKQLAKAICEFPAKETFVVGLYGAWGSGKTSILNMTMEYLSDLLRMGCGQNILIVPFNPWNFTSCNQLIDQFFKAILLKLDCNDQTQKQKAVGDALKKYSAIFGLAEYIPVVGPFLKILPQLFNGMGEQLIESAEAKDNNILFQKEQVRNALNEFPGKIVVVIDDIDRLPNDQIRLIFQLVTSVADFPHMIYLLSFDKKVVSNALKDTQQCDGEEYLEKIIQVPFEIPFVKSETIYGILHGELTALSPTETDPTYQKEHWQSVFDNCISPYIKTLRDINRFINTLRFKFPPLAEEVNFIDLAGITAIQLFDAPVYEWIKRNKDDLLGWSSRYLDAGLFGDKTDLKDQYHSIFQKIHPGEYQKSILAVASLYPVFSASIGESLEPPRADIDLRKYLSIASSNRFYSYFTLSLDDITIPQKDLNDSVDILNEFELNELLTKYLRLGVISDYFLALSAKLYDLTETRLQIVIKALYSLKFNLHNYSNSNADFQYLLHCQYVLSEALMLIKDEQSRCILYCELIKNASIESVLQNASHLYLMEQSQHRLPFEFESIRSPVFSIKSLVTIESCYIANLILISQRLAIFDWDNYSACSVIWKTFGKDSYEMYMSSILDIPENKLRYIALQMTISTKPLEEKQYMYNRNRLLGDLINTDDAVQIIENSLIDQSIFLLPDFILERLAAFFVHSSRDETKDVPPVSVEETKMQIKRWRDKYHTKINRFSN